MNLLQLEHPKHGRRVGLVEEPNVILLDESVTNTYDLFVEVINEGKKVGPTLTDLKTGQGLEYDLIYESRSEWRILPPIDLTNDPMKCILTGTGLTHKASAENRNKMHQGEKTEEVTDTIKMYLWGEEGGKPADNRIGVQPEWFYKGNGHNLRAHGQPLVVPNYADDGGEEPEIAGIYLISEEGIPYRLGFTQGNEFSDHIMEKKNYLYLAPSKMRNCAVGPELVLDHDFKFVPGRVSVMRQGETHWAKNVQSGEQAMAHTLANLEYNHFKYDQHRLAGQLHVHFFGTAAFSFGDGITLKQDDQMCISYENMGRALMNPLVVDLSDQVMPEIKTLN